MNLNLLRSLGVTRISGFVFFFFSLPIKLSIRQTGRGISVVNDLLCDLSQVTLSFCPFGFPFCKMGIMVSG